MAEIITLAGTFKSQLELQKYSDSQFLALKGAADKIKQLEDEVKHLQELIASTTSLIKVETIVKSPELQICEAQIRLFQLRSLDRELTLEETKQLDLLIKNKRLLSGDPTTIEGKKGKSKQDYPDEVLVRLAQKVEKISE